LEQIAKVPVYLNKQNQATFELTDTYRSASDVLDDLATKWDTLTNKQRLSIAEQIASKRQLTIFMALMQNFNAAVDARIVSLTSAGQAERAFGIIQETTAVKLEKLKSSWNSLTLAIGDTSAFKSAIDATINLLEHITALANVYQSYKNEATKANAAREKEISTTISQAESLKELTKLRNKYLLAPTTETNTKMLDKINKAIQEVQNNSNIKIDLNSEDATVKLENFIKTGKISNIKASVDLEFNVNKEIIQKRLKDLEFELGRVSISTILKRPELEKEQERLIKDLANIENKRTTEIEKRVSLYDAEITKQAALVNLSEQGDFISEELTNAEEEKIRIQEQLNLAKDSGVLTSKQLIDLEIKLTKNALYTYDAHQKTLKLAELEIEKRKAISDEYIKQRDAIRSQYVDFEKADILEKERLRRLMELLKLNPQELGQAFENDLFDKNIIIDYFNTFSQEGQDAINTMIQKLYDLPVVDLAKIFGGNINLANGIPTVTPVTNIKGAENININVDAGGMGTAEEVVNLINKMIRDTALTNEDFIQAFVKRIRPII
jgi:hypothetical protein